MKALTPNQGRLDILGTGIRSDQEVFSSVLRRWGQRLAYCSIFAAVPAVLATHLAEAGSDDSKKLEPSVAEGKARHRERLSFYRSNPALLRRQSSFLLPHQRGNFNLLAALAGNDDCPGRAIPGGTYSAAAPYTDSGDTTGANNSVSQAHDILYSYYYLDAFGSDHVYSFLITSRGANPQIEVSTTSGTYKPLIYILHGSWGRCPSGTGNQAYNQLIGNDSRWGSGNTAILNPAAMSYLPLNVPLHLFIDSRANDTNGSGLYTLRMQDVTIANTCANPIDCPEYFIQQHYFDFLNREPDAPGFAGWLALLNNCVSGDPNCDRLHISSAFFRSSEFQGRGYFLYRFYPVAFGRKPDYQEYLTDRWKVSGFLTDAQLEAAKVTFVNEFVSRTAFVTKFDGLNNTQYVDTLLSTAGITHAARDLWIAALGNGARTRAQVLREIAESAEVYNKYYNQAFVVMQYFGYLRRQPDALYLDWIAHLEATGDYRSMINGFVNSIEYRARFTAP
jgi:hypothetical protein